MRFKLGWTYRLVVPSAFLPVLRAEHTTTTLFWDRLVLQARASVVSRHAWTHTLQLLPRSPGEDILDNITSNLAAKSAKAPVSATAHVGSHARGAFCLSLSLSPSHTLSGNLPTLVPPNFWTIQPLCEALLCVELPICGR